MNIGNKTVLRGLFVATVVALFASFLILPTVEAATGINQQINFQGKLVNSNGTNIADGTYNLEFKIYQDGTASTGGTLEWTESRLISGGAGVVVSAGTFQVNLGSVTPFGSLVDWNQDVLWLSMNVGGTATTPAWDGEMTPRIRMTSVPYALNASMVGGIAASDLVRLSGPQQTGSISVSGGVTVGGALSVGGQTVISGGAKLQNIALDGSIVYTNLTGVGTVTSGTWNATAIAPSFGGTGNTSYSIGDLLYATGTTTLGKLTASPTAGSCVKSGGTGNPLTYGSCATSLQTAYNGGNTIALTAGTGITITASAPPTTNMFSISNAGQPVTTANANGVNINYRGGAAGVEAAGLRIDYTPGTTTGGTWSGMRIVANTASSPTGVSSYGVKIEGPTGADDGTENETGLYIGTGWDVGLNIASGGLQLASQTDPIANPAAGQLKLYAKSVAGRIVPKWISATDVDTTIQASYAFNRIAMATPSGGAGLSTYGISSSNLGTPSNATLAATNFLSSLRRTRFTSDSGLTSAGSMAGTYSSSTMAWRGNAAGLGGFFYTIRFNLAQLQTGNRGYIGLADSVAAPTNIDPTTSNAYSKIGVAFNANTGNLKWVNNNAGTAPTVTDLNTPVAFPVNTTNAYELVIFSQPNGTGVTWRLKNLQTGQATADTTVTTNIPANTAFLAPMMWMTNNTQTTAVAIETSGMYLETDN